MSLKAELETWASALKAYDEENFENALELFSRIADSSKILTNMGLIYATLGEHEAAVERFIEATGLDQYLAVAYFQCGVSNFLLGRYELALKDFEEALLYLRGNEAINYEQLGLKFKLYSAEVLFNKGLAQIYLGLVNEGLADMEEARKEKATEEHNVIDDAIQDRGDGYTVFSIPVGVLYRPSEQKLKNSKTKDYMGKAKLIAASDSTDAFTTFTGVTRLNSGVTPTGTFLEKSQADPAPNMKSVPTPTNRIDKPGVQPNVLGRSTSSNSAPSDTREYQSPTPASLARQKTSISPAVVSPNAVIGGPVQGLNVRKNPSSQPQGAADRNPGPTPPSKEQQGSRMTEFYDDYIDSYTDAAVPPLPNSGPPDRVATWARNNANANQYPPARSAPRSTPPSQYTASSFGGSSSMRRKLTRRTTAKSRTTGSVYEEEEEGYVSGEYDDGQFELIKIRVKLHYQDDVRGMALTPETPFEEFLDRVTVKFGKSMTGLGLKFKDEDGGRISLRDESDYELAIETARESAKGKPEGKLEIWCTDM